MLVSVWCLFGVSLVSTRFPALTLQLSSLLRCAAISCSLLHYFRGVSQDLAPPRRPVSPEIARQSPSKRKDETVADDEQPQGTEAQENAQQADGMQGKREVAGEADGVEEDGDPGQQSMGTYGDDSMEEESLPAGEEAVESVNESYDGGFEDERDVDGEGEGEGNEAQGDAKGGFLSRV